MYWILLYTYILMWLQCFGLWSILNEILQLLIVFIIKHCWIISTKINKTFQHKLLNINFKMSLSHFDRSSHLLEGFLLLHLRAKLSFQSALLKLFLLISLCFYAFIHSTIYWTFLMRQALGICSRQIQSLKGKSPEKIKWIIG